MEFKILKRDIESDENRKQKLHSPMKENPVLKLARYEVTESKLEKEMEEMSEKGIKKIDLYKVTFSDKKCGILAKGIKQNEHLLEIAVNKCKFRRDHMEIIADAIGSNEAIQ